MNIFLFELGEELESTINGFKGVVYSRIEYINGCIRYELKPTKMKDGKSIETEFIDEQELKLIKKVEKITPKKKGGSRERPKSNLNTKGF